MHQRKPVGRVRDRALRRGDRAGRSWTAAALGLGTALGAAALYNEARARAAEKRFPPIGRFTRVDGVELHYIDRGQGSPVVLIHGNGALVQDMLSSGLVEKLADKHRVIVFDRPGFGYSERPRSRIWSPAAQARLLARALEQIGVASPVVYGHSFGTLVALELALLDPDRLSGLVLGSGFYYPAPRLDVALLSPPAIPGIGDVLRFTISPILTAELLPRIYRRLFAPAPVPERFWREFPHELLRRPSHIRAAAADTALLIPGAERLQHRYQDLRLPVTIVAGAADRIIDTEANSVRLHRDIPGSRLLVVPDAGHMIHHLNPDVVVGAIEVASRTDPPKF